MRTSSNQIGAGTYRVQLYPRTSYEPLHSRTRRQPLEPLPYDSVYGRPGESERLS